VVVKLIQLENTTNKRTNWYLELKLATQTSFMKF